MTDPVVLLEHHLVSLVLSPHAEHLHLHLLLPAVVLLLELHLLLHLLLSLELLLRPSLVLLLLAKSIGVLALESLGLVVLTLLGGFTLSDEGLLLALVLAEHSLLFLNIGRGRVEDRRRRRSGWRLDGSRRLGSVGEGGRVSGVLQVGRFLSELWYVDETGEVLEVGALVVELSEVEVLGVVSTSQRLEGLHRSRRCKDGGSAPVLNAARSTQR